MKREEPESREDNIDELRKKTELLLRDSSGVSSSMRRKISEAVKVDGVLNNKYPTRK